MSAASGGCRRDGMAGSARSDGVGPSGRLRRPGDGQRAPADPPDPTILARTGWPNDWLICPAGACAAEASAAPATYQLSPERLFAAWQEMLAAQPRTTIIGTDPPRPVLPAQDRTPVLRFVDTVSIRVLPAAEGRSTFAAYSRSNLGLGDLGANRRRLEEWMATLDRRLARRPAGA